MKIKPRDGLIVLNETTGKALKSGDNVPNSHYYRRRIACGDLEIIKNKEKK